MTPAGVLFPVRLHRAQPCTHGWEFSPRSLPPNCWQLPPGSGHCCAARPPWFGCSGGRLGTVDDDQAGDRFRGRVPDSGESKKTADGWSELDSEPRNYFFDWRLLLGHAVAMAAVVALSSVVFGKGTDGLLSNVEILVWIATGLAAIALAACALIPAGIWIAKIRGMRDLLIFAPAAGAAACILGKFASSFWKPLSSGTFTIASIMLHPFLAHVVANRTTLTLGSDRFNVTIAPACSGYEGIGLVLAVTGAWLWFLRRQVAFSERAGADSHWRCRGLDAQLGAHCGGADPDWKRWSRTHRTPRRDSIRRPAGLRSV